QSEPWTRWWWMGSAVDRENLTAELEGLAAAGLGGVEVTSTYGVRGYGHAFVPYLSDRWIELLLHAAAEARRLGMGLDMPPGSGWRLGGPGVRLEDAVASLRIEVDTARGTYVATIRPAGDKVKRAAPGGEGNALDPFSRVAVQRYLDAYGERIKTLPRGTVRAFFHDSFEYTGNGSAELFEEFLRRRGFALGVSPRALPGVAAAESPPNTPTHTQIRVLGRACRRETTHVRRDRHVARRALHGHAGPAQAGGRPAVRERRESRDLSRHGVFAAKCRLAGLAVLRL